MCKALQKLLGSLCFVFIDDILVFSKSVNSHLSDLKEVLESLRNGNLSVKLEKCSFFQSQVEYLGHRISGEGIACINNGKLEAMSRPNNVKELQRFWALRTSFVNLYLFSVEWLIHCINCYVKIKNSFGMKLAKVLS